MGEPNLHGVNAWLANNKLVRGPLATDAKTGGVFGAVLHSTETQAEELYDFLDFLAERDPEGLRSRTVREIAEGGLLPEQEVPAALLEKREPPTPNPDGGPCGDGICDEKQKADAALCPEDVRSRFIARPCVSLPESSSLSE